MVNSFSRLLPSRFTPAIRCSGLGVRADTAVPRVRRGRLPGCGLWNSQPGSYFHAHVQHRWVVLILPHSHGACCGMGRHGYCLEFDADSFTDGHANPTPAVTARLGNISTSGLVKTGSDVMIGGFIFKGAERRQSLCVQLVPS